MADNKNSKKGKNDKAFRRPRKKVCTFCVEKIDDIDYKDVEKLRNKEGRIKFLSFCPSRYGIDWEK